MSINENIKKLRTERKLTQIDLAKEMNCNRQKIADWERGKSTPSADDIILLSKKFNVSADYLLGLSDVQTTDKDVQFICDYTGLSGKSVDVLSFFNEYDVLIPTVNKLLEGEMRSVLEELKFTATTDTKDTVVLEIYETQQVISAIEQYLNYKKPLPKDDVSLNITQSGKIVNLDEIDEKDSSVSWEDLYTIDAVKQSELIEKVLLDRIIERIKSLKKGGD